MNEAEARAEIWRDVDVRRVLADAFMWLGSSEQAEVTIDGWTSERGRNAFRLAELAGYATMRFESGEQYGCYVVEATEVGLAAILGTEGRT